MVKSKVIYVRLDEIQYEIVKRTAKENHLPMSSFMRLCVIRMVDGMLNGYKRNIVDLTHQKNIDIFKENTWQTTYLCYTNNVGSK